MFIKLASSQFIIYNQVRMSIPNITDKIKSKISIDKVTVLYLFIILGVGISSFGLGRLSLSNNPSGSGNINLAVTEKEKVGESTNWGTNINNGDISTTPSIDRKSVV